MDTAVNSESRMERKRRRNRQVLIEAAYEVISSQGIDSTTMQKISEVADVGLGTIYNYFDSKEDLVMQVMALVMDHMAQRILKVTDTFSDSAQVCAYGYWSLMDQTMTDPRWHWLINRPDVFADAMYNCFGPYAITDMKNGVAEGRYIVDNPELVWRQTVWAIVGVIIAVDQKEFPISCLEDAIVNLLYLLGVDRVEAREIAQRPRPKLPKENLFDKK